MPKTKKAPKPFNTEKDVIEGRAVENAPVVGGEFITEDGDWQGQTVQVQSDKHLEDDLGTGEPVIIRSYRFAANPLAFKDRIPTVQEIFDSHRRGITALLWQDGLTPAEDVPPHFVLSKEKNEYLITIAARPQTGQAVIESPQTLSQIVNGKTNIT